VTLLTALFLAVAVVHALAAAGWLGGMLYSLLVVQPKAARFFGPDDEAYEGFQATIASGNRWKVLGLMAILALSGCALLLLHPPATTAKLVLHLVEAALLLVALGVFVYVSWRLWPRRVFALPEEQKRLRERFTRCAYALVALVGAAFLIGVVSSQVA
jgi:uncharacterized membrane protein